MRHLAVAVTTLTRVRLPGRLVAGGDAARSTMWFPLVGAGIGLVVGAVLLGVALATRWVLVAAVLAVAVEVVLTGALHLDGLADSADGLAGRSREQRLAIMKDHASGVYGVTAVVLDLLLKTACLAALLGSGLGPVGLLVVLAGGYALSRTAFLPLARALPYARAQGTGRAVIDGVTTGHVLVAFTWVAVVVAGGVAVAATVGPSQVGLACLAMVAAAVVTAGAVGLGARRLLGGITGDVLGATAELVLLAGLVVALAS